MPSSQDVTKTRYATYAELLDYSRRSANPVGRLVLHCFEKTGNARFSREQSDAICSALQFINFCAGRRRSDWAEGAPHLHPAGDLRASA
jgi:phytoene/squalene synthetase